MATTLIRTKAELDRALWAEKRMAVAEGKLYTDGEDSPFPVHEYFKMGLLGKNVKMVEVNAGHAMIENIVADALTELQVKFYKDEKKKTLNADLEAEFMQFLTESEYHETHEQFMRDLYGAGYGVEQPVRQPEAGADGKDLISICNVEPSTWYPDIPPFAWQKVTSGRIITAFSEMQKKGVQWYLFVEKHTIGHVEYELYEVNDKNALEGVKVELGASERFKDVEDRVYDTDLDRLAVFQQNLRKMSGMSFGASILAPVWSYLQEVSEIQTQIRQERIKHFRSKMYATRESLARARNVPGGKKGSEYLFTSKEIREGARGGANLGDATQDLFAIPQGATPPGYIRWDMQILAAGSAEIDKCLSRAAAISGFPRSIFNLDEKGEVHEGTDRRKNRRYVMKVLQGQRRSEAEIRAVAEAWLKWRTAPKPAEGEEPVKEGDPEFKVIEVKRATPFGLTEQEIVTMMREQNTSANFVSQREAIRRINPAMTEEAIDAMIEEMHEESSMLAPANSLLDEAPTVDLPEDE